MTQQSDLDISEVSTSWTDTNQSKDAKADTDITRFDTAEQSQCGTDIPRVAEWETNDQTQWPDDAEETGSDCGYTWSPEPSGNAAVLHSSREQPVPKSLLVVKGGSHVEDPAWSVAKGGNDNSGKKYWTWDKKRQQFYHVDEATEKRVYFPDRFY